MSRELFDIVFADLGGILNLSHWEDCVIDNLSLQNISNLQDAFERRAEEINGIFKMRNVNKKIHINIINNIKINGCCSVSPAGDYLVGINVGVILRLQILSFILFEIDCGNSELFAKHDSSWIYGLLGYGRLEDDSGHFEVQKIRDQAEQFDALKLAALTVRSRLGESKSHLLTTGLAAMIAVDFILTHELHHVAMGHIDFVVGNLGFSRLWESEVDPTDDNSFEPTTEQSDISFRRGLEGCSDFCAGLIVGRNFESRNGIIHDMGMYRFDDKVYSRMLSFSVKLCLSVLGFETSLLDAKHQRNSHPHPEVRLFKFFDGVIAGCEERFPEVDEDWREGFAEGYWAITNAYQQIQILEPIMWSITSNMQAWYGSFTLSSDVRVLINELNDDIARADGRTKELRVPFLGGFGNTQPT